MSAALVLPFVWAYAEPMPESEIVRLPPSELTFYRCYTEAILLRYVRMAMEAGKVPSLLGKEMFHGNVTSYKVGSFDDVVMADLSVLKSQMKEICGNGQPGRLAQLEGRILDHEKAVQRLKGIAAAFGALLTCAHLAIDILIGRR